MYVLLQRYPDGYYSLQKATCHKHFDMIDNKGFVEICSGDYEDLLGIKRRFEIEEFNSNKDNLLYKDATKMTLIQLTKQTLPILLKYNENFLENKTQIYEM